MSLCQIVTRDGSVLCKWRLGVACLTLGGILGVWPSAAPAQEASTRSTVGAVSAAGDGGADATAMEAPPADAARRLDQLVRAEWRRGLKEWPLTATRTGSRDGIDRLGSFTLADEARRAEGDREALEKLRAIDPASLEATDRVTWQVMEWLLVHNLESFELGHYLIPWTADSGFHTGYVSMPNDLPLRTVADFEAYISRLYELPRVFRERIELMESAVEKGWTLPAASIEGYDHTMVSHVVEDPKDSAFYKPFLDFPSTIPASEHGRLRKAGAEAVEKGAIAAYDSLLTFFRDTYLPNARKTLGASEMPGGGPYYEHLVRFYTTLDITPEEVHQLGLQEVARIRAEMEAVIEKTGFEGSFADFFEFLRTDPQFFAETPQALLERASFLAKKMDGKLPALFGRLPRQPYGVEPVPDYLAPKYTAGRYVGAPLDSKRGGTYWVNTYALDKRPLYTLEALTLHEAMPGHHLQIALTAELDLPEFRRRLYISAFGEGWALYAERLGLEAGFYQDPYTDFGRLTYEMWRACRLVVDTGIHAKGWGRRQSIDYMAERTALSLHEVTTEIDRYISWPGQALSYKMGELEIRRLRALAEKELGGDFDIRQFHDRVLSQGALPLQVLRQEIDRWITETRR